MGTRRDRRRARLLAHKAAQVTTKRHEPVAHSEPACVRDTARALFRSMLPNVPRKVVTKASVPVHGVTVLQTLTARGTGAHTKRKRTIRYQSKSKWHGFRVGEGQQGYRTIRMVTPKREG